MSRNLLKRGKTCYYCDYVVKLLEQPRPITEEDAGCYFHECEGMLVAKAHCPICLAKYLAWIDQCEGVDDLSFLSTFNDEPSDDDLPKFIVEQRWVRVKQIRN